MAVPAHQHEVVETGLAPAGPRDDVMRFALVGRSAAADACPVASDERMSLRGSECSARGCLVEGCELVGEQHHREVGVAAQTLQGARRDGSAAQDFGDARPAADSRSGRLLSGPRRAGCASGADCASAGAGRVAAGRHPWCCGCAAIRRCASAAGHCRLHRRRADPGRLRRTCTVDLYSAATRRHRQRLHRPRRRPQRTHRPSPGRTARRRRRRRIHHRRHHRRAPKQTRRAHHGTHRRRQPLADRPSCRPTSPRHRQRRQRRRETRRDHHRLHRHHRRPQPHLHTEHRRTPTAKPNAGAVRPADASV